MKAQELLIRETMPNKNYFKMSEVADLLQVKPHELRFWECEFPQIRSQKSKNGQRVYKKDDVILFSAVKHLLHDKKFTLPGAVRVINDSFSLSIPVPSAEAAAASANETEATDLKRDSAPEEILRGASVHLSEGMDYDARLHEVYQACGEELADPAIRMTAETLQDRKQESKEEFEKSFLLLSASKKALQDVLKSLDRFKGSFLAASIY